jgi:hypothetical protein
VSPSGGEYWLLSESGQLPNDQVVTWAMSDNVRICEVETSLLYSNDGGASYLEAPAGGGLPSTFGPGVGCSGQGELTTSLTYSVPTSPSGQSGSLYKIRVVVTDQAGNAKTVESDAFYIVQSNPDSVKTLILKNTDRMQAVMGVSAEKAAALDLKLVELSHHPRVQGFVVDLAGITDVGDLLAGWDLDPADPDKANAVLFGCHGNPLPAYCAAVGGERAGVHEIVRDLLEVYSGVETRDRRRRPYRADGAWPTTPRCCPRRPTPAAT